MKTIKIAVTLLLTLTVMKVSNAQTADLYVIFNVYYNSNETSHAVYQELQLMSSGTDALDIYDFGDTTVIPAGSLVAHPFSMSADGHIITQNDSRPHITGYKTIDFGFYSNYHATISLTSVIMTGMSQNSQSSSPVGPQYCILERISTGETYELMNDSATLNIPANTNYNIDFRLHFGPAVTETATPASCFNSNDGSLHVTNPNHNGWTLDIYRNGVFQNSTYVSGTDTTITGLQADNYSSVVRVNSIRIDSSNHSVTSPAAIVPAFSPSDINPWVNGSVSFTNTSVGASGYTWDFGDAVTDTAANPSHIYTSAGTYTVTLTASNGSCYSVTNQVINVSAPPLAPPAPQSFDPDPDQSVNENSTDRTGEFPNPVFSVSEGQIHVAPPQVSYASEVSLHSCGGQLIHKQNMSGEEFSITVPAAGLYILTASKPDGTHYSEKIFLK